MLVGRFVPFVAAAVAAVGGDECNEIAAVDVAVDEYIS